MGNPLSAMGSVDHGKAFGMGMDGMDKGVEGALRYGDLLPGDPLANTVLGIGTGANNDFQAKQYDPNAASYQIGNQYGGALGQALAGAQGRATPNAQAAQINTAQSDQVRAQQAGLTGALQARASGQAPSAAELQMQQGLGQAIASQRAQAASARGVSPAMAQRMAAQGIAGAQQQTVAQTAQLRAQEQAQAEGALAQHLGGMRGQDAGLAAQQAGLTQQTSLANQQAELANRAQMDSATQAYIAQGMSREEAQQKALAEMETLKANQAISANQLNQATAEANTGRVHQAQGGLLNAGGNLLGGLLSDERRKTAIKSGDKASSAFLEGLRAHRFRYKGDKTEHLGVMAQDVERAPGGRGMVRETPHGKMIDVPQAVGRLLAASATLHQRIKKIEGAHA